jgi:hypothetical protein
MTDREQQDAAIAQWLTSRSADDWRAVVIASAPAIERYIARKYGKRDNTGWYISDTGRDIAQATVTRLLTVDSTAQNPAQLVALIKRVIAFAAADYFRARGPEYPVAYEDDRGEPTRAPTPAATQSTEPVEYRPLENRPHPINRELAREDGDEFASADYHVLLADVFAWLGLKTSASNTDHHLVAFMTTTTAGRAALREAMAAEPHPTHEQARALLVGIEQRLRDERAEHVALLAKYPNATPGDLSGPGDGELVGPYVQDRAERGQAKTGAKQFADTVAAADGTGRICQAPGCTESLEGRRPNVKTCSDRCRQELARS